MDRISRVKSHVVSFVELLDDMFLRSLKLSNPHTNEYLDRLQAEYAVVDALERAFQVSFLVSFALLRVFCHALDLFRSHTLPPLRSLLTVEIRKRFWRVD